MGLLEKQSLAFRWQNLSKRTFQQSTFQVRIENGILLEVIIIFNDLEKRLSCNYMLKN